MVGVRDSKTEVFDEAVMGICTSGGEVTERLLGVGGVTTD